MKVNELPHNLLKDEACSRLIISHYQPAAGVHKSRTVLHLHMIQLMINGCQTIVRAGGCVTVKGGELLLISNGHCLISEGIPDDAPFKSLVIYFSANLLDEFLSKYNKLITDRNTKKERQVFLRYSQDTFIRNFVLSLEIMLLHAESFNEEMKKLKLEELLLYLLILDPEKLLSLQETSWDNDGVMIRKAAEISVDSLVTVDELAFLCDCSRSTFKRKFAKVYGTAPQKWLLEEKMKLAGDLLSRAGQRPGKVYQRVGYENHSSFTYAFRHYYGMTPKAYQDSKLNLQL